MKSICVDFDRVIHQYTTPWSHASIISDPPVAGAFEWLTEMVDHYIVNIFSSRSDHPEGVEAMQEWFKTHGLSPLVLCYLRFPTHKPPAVLYIDDRAYRFEGTFPTVKQIAEFEPWHPHVVWGQFEAALVAARSGAADLEDTAEAHILAYFLRHPRDAHVRISKALRKTITGAMILMNLRQDEEATQDVETRITALAEELVTVAAGGEETLVSVHSTVKLPDGRQYGLTLERLDATT